MDRGRHPPPSGGRHGKRPGGRSPRGVFSGGILRVTSSRVLQLSELLDMAARDWVACSTTRTTRRFAMAAGLSRPAA